MHDDKGVSWTTERADFSVGAREIGLPLRYQFHYRSQRVIDDIRHSRSGAAIARKDNFGERSGNALTEGERGFPANERFSFDETPTCEYRPWISARFWLHSLMPVVSSTLEDYSTCGNLMKLNEIFVQC